MAENIPESNTVDTVYLSPETISRIGAGTGRWELPSIFQPYIPTVSDLSLKDFAAEIDKEDEGKFIIDKKQLEKYTIGNNEFIFHDLMCIYAKMNLLIDNKQTISEFNRTLLELSGYPVESSTKKGVDIWQNGETVFTINNLDSSATVIYTNRNYLTDKTLAELSISASTNTDYSYLELFLLDLNSSKKVVENKIKDITKNSAFSLEAYAMPFNYKHIPENKGLNKSNIDSYIWNGVKLFFHNNKLNLCFREEYRSNIAEYQLIKNAAIAKYGSVYIVDNDIELCLKDNAILIFSLRRKKFLVALGNKEWLSEDEIKQVDEAVQKTQE